MEREPGRMRAHRSGAVGWMVFDNPARHNAVSLAMWEAVPGILADFAADPEIRVVVVTGAGERAFVSGADISEFESRRAAPEAVQTYDAATERALEALQDCPKPTLAMIRGFCFGGGLAVALGCDLRIAAADARFAIPAAKLGLGYRVSGIARLVAIVGPAFAQEILFTARSFSAEEARAMGLVNRIVPAAELAARIDEETARIVANAPLTIAAAKRAIAELAKEPAARDLAACQAAVDACFESADYAEGRRAFLEKRPPRFEGR